MFVAPVVAWLISAPPTTPLGTSRSSSLGFTTFMPGSLRVEPVVEPLLAVAADAVVDLLGAHVVLGRLPGEPARPALEAGGAATLDQRLRGTGPAAPLSHEEVVHQPNPRGAQRRPQPEHGREPDRDPRAVTRDELDPVVLRRGDQRARQRQQLLVGRRDLVEVRVPPHQREQLVEVLGPDQRDRRHVVIPVNCPPVMFRTCPCTKFDHGEHRKNTPPAASCGVPGRPSGISIDAIPRIWSGMPSWTFSPPISITLDSSLDAVSRVSM